MTLDSFGGRRALSIGGGRVAMRERQSGQPDVVTYPRGDHLGSTAVALEPSGARIGAKKY